MKMRIIQFIFVAVIAFALAGCGPSRFERLMSKYHVQNDPLVDIGTREDVAELYGPPHKETALETADIWSYHFGFKQTYASSSGYGYYHHDYDPWCHRHGYSYHYGPPIYSTDFYRYDLIFRFDKKGILRRWRLRHP